MKKLLRFIGFAAVIAILIFSCRTEIPFDPGPMNPDPVDTSMMDPTDTTVTNPDTNSNNPHDTSLVETCDTAVIYFDSQILPILVGNCAYAGCHDPITAEKDLIFDSFNNIFRDDKAIVPFDLEKSKLYRKITEDDLDDRMPPPPNQALTAEQIALIGQWILQGAKNTTCASVSACDTMEVSYSQEVQPILNTYCVTCHGSSNPNGGISLTSYARVQQTASTGKLYGVISWSSGFLKMPLGGTQIPECDIDKIGAWISQGTPEN